MPDIVDLLQALPPAVTPGPIGSALAAADVARGHRALLQRRRRRLAGVAGTVTAGAVGAVAVVLAAAPSAPAPVAQSVTPPAAQTGSATPAATAASPLMTLAARITATAGSQPGNASLQIADYISQGKVWDVYYGLYTDSGALYSGDSKQTLMTAVADHANQADGADLEVAAARDAATGNLAAARVRMIDTEPNDFFLSAAAREKIWKAGAASRAAAYKSKGLKPPVTMPSGKFLQEQINNTLWNQCSEALNWAGGNSRIRAGVLRLLSTIPRVTVAHSTTGGQPTLTITAGTSVFGPGSEEVLIVNATTGLPVSLVSTTPGVSAATETFQVSRVTLAEIEAGKF